MDRHCAGEPTALARSSDKAAVGQQPWLHDLAICVDGNGTALSEGDGSMRARGAHGFFVDDQRVVSRFTVGLGASELVEVAHTSQGPRSEFFTSARGLGDRGPDPTVELLRHRRVAGGTLHEEVVVTSRALEAFTAPLVVTVGGDGADIGLVKAGVATGPVIHPLLTSSAAQGCCAEWGTDELVAQVTFTPVPDSVVTTAEGVVATFHLAIDPGADIHVDVTVSTQRVGESHFAADAGSDAVDWPSSLQVEAGDPRLGKLLEASLVDLRSLLLRDPADRGDIFAAAGTPWYLTLFGRDSLWTARMMLPLGTTLAEGTLRALARRQGTEHDVDTAETPGKIPHELRRRVYEDVTADFNLPPVYWGTVDATALWICLLHDAWRWGMPADSVRDLLPQLRAAAAWLTDEAAPDEDGFIKYVDESGHGLANQGWKDSGDSMRFRDGSLATSPISLVEAQAYAVEAAVGAAAVLRALGDAGGGGDDRDRADALERWADALADRMRAHFWVGPPGGRYLAMAIDGEARPVDGVGSNMGHALGTGALTPDEAREVTDTLVGPTMLGPYGIPTLATDNGGFNPLGYHTGSVWVHDTAICALGMAREGHAEQAALVVQRLLDVGEAFDYRLPELLADSATLGRPAPYPAACRPQAWAAASSVAMLTVALGISVDVPRRTVSVRPPVPLPFGALTVTGIQIGEAAVTVVVDTAGGVVVTGMPDGYTLLA